MTKKRLVIALGGNALGNTPQEQLELVKKTAKTIVDLSENYDVAVGHGNGPQVGMINNAMEFSANKGGNTPEMPFPECGAMSQGYIGYHLSQSIRNELKNRGKDSEIACVVTQVLVDKDDEAFNKPTENRNINTAISLPSLPLFFLTKERIPASIAPVLITIPMNPPIHKINIIRSAASINPFGIAIIKSLKLALCTVTVSPALTAFIRSSYLPGSNDFIISESIA